MFLPCINKSDDDDDVFNFFSDDFQYKREIGNNDREIYIYFFWGRGGGVNGMNYGQCEMVNY